MDELYTNRDIQKRISKHTNKYKYIIKYSTLYHTIWCRILVDEPYNPSPDVESYEQAKLELFELLKQLGKEYPRFAHNAGKIIEELTTN